MIHTLLPLGTNEHRAPAGNMVTLPSIRELGLWTPGGIDGHPASPPNSMHPVPRSSDILSRRQLHCDDRDTSPHSILPQPTYTYHSRSPVSSKCSTSAPSHWDASSRTRSIFAVEPHRHGERRDTFEEYSSCSDRRRGSADSVLSTPSLVGSFASSCSSSNGTSPALAPSTPGEVPNSAYYWDLGGQEHPLTAAPESDSWIKTLLQHPLYSRIPRRSSFKGHIRSPRLGSQQHPPYKVQKRERAKPKNTGQAHCNEKYTTEENRFLIYFRVDHPMSWQQLEVAYNERFTRGSRPHRTDGGLQSQFYRLNTVCPEMTDDKLLVFGPRSKLEADKHKYNEYDNMTFDCKVRLGGKVSLIDRYAEQIVEENWSWISREDMARAKRLADRRRPHRLAWEAYKKANPLPVKVEDGTSSPKEEPEN